MDLSYLWFDGGGVDSVMPVLNSSIIADTDGDAELPYEKLCVHSHNGWVPSGRTYVFIF